MRMIKKFSFVLLLLLSVGLLTGCDSKKEKNVEGTLEEIMSKVYEKVPEDDRPMALTNIEVNEENIVTFLGTSDIEYESILASEPMVSSIAHSVILIRTKEGADVGAIKTKIKENINPRKWVCVWVEDDDVIIDSKGDLIIVIMVEQEEIRTLIQEGFNNL